jgi:hypothetical protein
MKLTFIQPQSFVTDWKRLGLNDEDLQALEGELLDRSTAGVVMKGTGGLRKMRFAPPSANRGKSGATRVCYIVFAPSGSCYLLMIFSKSDQANLSGADKAAWRKWIAAKRKEQEK